MSEISPLCADPKILVEDLPGLTGALMHARQTVLPKRLVAPGPDAAQLQQILHAAATAPDHGRLRPWRFVQVSDQGRGPLADVFAAALQQRDARATPEEMARAREKAHRAPLLLLAVVDGACGDRGIDLNERLVSLGCALQNMLLMATAQGFGSALTSGKALKDPQLHALFGLSRDELALCFVSVGTAHLRKPVGPRPEPRDFLTSLPAQQPASGDRLAAPQLSLVIGRGP